MESESIHQELEGSQTKLIPDQQQKRNGDEAIEENESSTALSSRQMSNSDTITGVTGDETSSSIEPMVNHPTIASSHNYYNDPRSSHHPIELAMTTTTTTATTSGSMEPKNLISIIHDVKNSATYTYAMDKEQFQHKDDKYNVPVEFNEFDDHDEGHAFTVMTNGQPHHNGVTFPTSTTTSTEKVVEDDDASSMPFLATAMNRKGDDESTVIPPEFTSDVDMTALFCHHHGAIPPTLHTTTSSGTGVATMATTLSSSVTSASTTSITATAGPISVRPHRKEELLRQAHADRLAWLQQVSFPYFSQNRRRRRKRIQHHRAPAALQRLDANTTNKDHHAHVLRHDNDNDNDEYLDEIWTQDDRLNLFHSCHAVQHLPSITRVLTDWYGMNNGISDENMNHDGGDVKGDDDDDHPTPTTTTTTATTPASVERLASRIQSILEPLGMTDNLDGVTNTNHDRLNHISGSKSRDDDYDEGLLEDTNFVNYYRNHFWSHLTTPECATLVQSMRTFVRNLENRTLKAWADMTSVNATAASTTTSGSIIVDQNENGVMERFSMAVHNYTMSTLQTILAHPVWKQHDLPTTTDESLLLRRSLESFLYGNFTNLLENVVIPSLNYSNKDEDAWINRILTLQFIHARHLELDCLVASTSNDDDDDETGYECHILHHPIQILQSIDDYFSPFEKLQRILAVYHSINAALSQALNQHSGGDPSSSSKTTTTPNDQHKRLPSADDVLPTLILTVLRAKPKRVLWNLRMIEALARPEYLRGEAGYAYTNLYGAIQFLQDLNLTDMDQSSLSIRPEEFRQGLEICRRQAAVEQAKSSSSSLSVPTKSTDGFPSNQLIQGIRSRPSVHVIRQARVEGQIIDLEWAMKWQDHDQEQILVSQSKSAVSPMGQVAPSIPRPTYTFLSARPEDIRVADLPLLLDEYRTLAHTTEIMLADRALEANSARKQRQLEQKATLQAKAEAVNLGLSTRKRSSTNPT